MPTHPVIKYRFRERRRTSAEWLAVNEVLLNAEVGWESDTGRTKTGDGATAWNDLGYDVSGRLAPGATWGDKQGFRYNAVTGLFEPAPLGKTYQAGAGITIDSPTSDTPVVNATPFDVDNWVSTYASLPAPPDEGTGAAYQVTDGGSYPDNLIYIWNGTAWPNEGAGLSPLAATASWPSGMFSGASEGIRFDFTDKSTLFQDVAGTVPVTAFGQKVARINDISGFGNTLTQSDAAKQATFVYPLYGMVGLSFSGSEYYDCASLSVGEALTCAIAVKSTANNGRVLDARGVGPLGTLKGWQMKATNPNSDLFDVDDGAGHGLSTSTSTSTSIVVNIGRFSKAESLFDGIQNGQFGTSSTSGFVSLSNTSAFRVGAARNDASQGFQGIMYQAFFTDVCLTDEKASQLYAYLKKKYL